MAFEKAFENTYDELTQETKYRFAELELGKAVQLFTIIYHNALAPREKAISTIYDAIIPKQLDNDENKHYFHQSMNTTAINKPPKIELIHYFIMSGQSYQTIRNLTGCSFNTISKARYGTPHYYPTFNRWTPEMLLNWNRVKPTLNLWNEGLVHS